jgi:ferredoxin-NADP reductase
MIESLRSQLKARGMPGSQIHAEEFNFAKVGRPAPAQDELSPSALAADAKQLASLAAVAFAGPALAIAVLVGSYLVGGR